MDKYRALAPTAGRCVKVDGVSIRVDEVTSAAPGRKKPGTATVHAKCLVSLCSQQVPCPSDKAQRCGECILSSSLNARIHPDWFDIANGVITD